MSEMKQKRYPTDRLKLHELLEKREKQLQNLQEDVKTIRQLVKQSDATAITATAELYNITPEQLAEIMKKMYCDKSKPVPVSPQELKVDSGASTDSENKEDSIDEEDA